MAKPVLNRHAGKKSPLTVDDSRITRDTDVDPPFSDESDPSITFGAVRVQATPGRIRMQLTGQGYSASAVAPSASGIPFDGTLIVTLIDAAAVPIVPAPRVDVTYVDDPSFHKKHKRTVASTTSAEKNTAKKPTSKQKPRPKVAKKTVKKAAKKPARKAARRK